MSFLPPEMTPDRRVGRISLVGAGPGAADLLTLRALDRLKTADVVYYDRLVEPEVLALTSSLKISVGKELGASLWPQNRIDRLIVQSALEGMQVVRLKSGDPSVFGRASEELAAAQLAGIPVEIIPGITAASAAAARLTHPLTERGQTERLVIATATCCPGEKADLAAGFAPGTTLALYMAMHRLAEVEAELLATGAPEDCEVEFLQSVGSANERLLRCKLRGMAEAAAGFSNPTVILIRWPKEPAKTPEPRLLSAVS